MLSSALLCWPLAHKDPSVCTCASPWVECVGAIARFIELRGQSAAQIVPCDASGEEQEQVLITALRHNARISVKTADAALMSFIDIFLFFLGPRGGGGRRPGRRAVLELFQMFLVPVLTQKCELDFGVNL